MATVIKAKKTVPSTVLTTSTKTTTAAPAVEHQYDNLTVEQYLEMRFQELVEDLRNHTEELIAQFQKQYTDGAAAIEGMIPTNTQSSVCVVLKCIAGPHIGQRFRLEATDENTAEVFKMGRSTGKQFKEKGVSLYKDKEISTTHAKIELRNGEAFFIDAKSTNGSLFNGEDAEPTRPYRLKEGDVIGMGSTELVVHLSAIDEKPAEQEE